MAYPDTDDECVGPSTPYLPPRPCAATELLMSLCLERHEAPKVIDLAAHLFSPSMGATSAARAL